MCGIAKVFTGMIEEIPIKMIRQPEQKNHTHQESNQGQYWQRPGQKQPFHDNDAVIDGTTGLTFPVIPE